MTSLHRKWSPKVTIPVDKKKDDGGVAACMNWSYGTKPRMTKEVADMKDKLEKDQANERLLRAAETLLRDQEEREHAESRLSHCRHDSPRRDYPITDAYQREPEKGASYATGKDSGLVDVYIPDIPGLGADRRPGTPYRRLYSPDIRPLTPEKRLDTPDFEAKVTGRGLSPYLDGRNGYRVPMPAAITNRSEHVESWLDHTPHPPEKTNNTKPEDDAFKSTKKFLQKYINRSLNDMEIRSVMKGTQKHLRKDMDHISREEEEKENRYTGRTSTRPPMKAGPFMSKPCPVHPRNGELRVARSPEKRVPPKGYTPLRSRPSSAHATTSRDQCNHVSWGMVKPDRPGSAPRAIDGPSPSYNNKGDHFQTWRPNGSAPAWPWTQSVNAYDDLWRLANKSKEPTRPRTPKMLGASKYAERNHYRAEEEYLKLRPASQQGKVNLQMDCPDDSDMLVSVRVKTARGSKNQNYRY